MNRISWRPWPTYIHIVVDVKNRLHCFTTHSLFLHVTGMFFYCLFAVFPIASVVVVMGLTQISNFRFNGLSIVFVQWIFFHFPIFPLFSLNLFLFFFLVCTNLNVKWFSLCNFGNNVAPQIIKLSTENGESEEKNGRQHEFIYWVKSYRSLDQSSRQAKAIRAAFAAASVGLIVRSKAAPFTAAAAIVAHEIEGWGTVAGAAAGVL